MVCEYGPTGGRETSGGAYLKRHDFAPEGCHAIHDLASGHNWMLLPGIWRAGRV